MSSKSLNLALDLSNLVAVGLVFDGLGLLEKFLNLVLGVDQEMSTDHVVVPGRWLTFNFWIRFVANLDSGSRGDEGENGGEFHVNTFLILILTT